MAKKTAEEFRDGSPGELAGKSPEDLVDLYLRRSKKRETVETLKQHARDLRREMDRQGLTVRKVWLEQRSASKQHVRREKLEGAMAAVMDGEIKTLAVWKTDRFDRRGMAAIGTALDEFDRRQARLFVLQERLDSSQPGTRIVFAILAERAREEIKDLTLRVTTGKNAARTAGRWPGGRTPYKQEALDREMTLVLRTTDRTTEPAPTLPVLPVGTDPLLQLQYETQPADGPGATRCVSHPHELALGGIPVMCSTCRARRDWLLINHGRNVWIRCRCSKQWLEPEISRADFDALVASPYGMTYPTVEQGLAALGFDGTFAGTYLE